MAVRARCIHGDLLRWHGGRASIFQVMNSQVSLRSHSEGSIISDVVPTLGLRLPKHSQKTMTSSGTHVSSREKTPLLEHTQHIVPGQWIYVSTQIPLSVSTLCHPTGLPASASTALSLPWGLTRTNSTHH